MILYNWHENAKGGSCSDEKAQQLIVQYLGPHVLCMKTEPAPNTKEEEMYIMQNNIYWEKIKSTSKVSHCCEQTRVRASQ